MRQLKDQADSRRQQQREMVSRLLLEACVLLHQLCSWCFMWLIVLLMLQEPAGLEIQFGMYGKLPSRSELKQLSQQEVSIALCSNQQCMNLVCAADWLQRD